jgi:hypothetical protein
MSSPTYSCENCHCHSERTGPQTFFSLGVVSEESAFAFSKFSNGLLGHNTSVMSLK